MNKFLGPLDSLTSMQAPLPLTASFSSDLRSIGLLSGFIHFSLPNTTCSAPTELQSFIPPIPPHRYTFCAPPDLHSSMPPRRYTYSEHAKLQSSMHRYLQPASRPPYLHVTTPIARLPSSIPPHRYTLTAHLQSLIPPYLPTSIPPYLRVATPAERLQSSMLP